MLEVNKIYFQDCLKGMKLIDDKSIDLVLTDPPYGTTACKWDAVIPFELMWGELKRATKKNGAIVLFGSQPFTSALVMSNPKMFKYEWVWEKDNASNFMLLKKQPGKRHENLLVFYRHQPTYHPQMWSGEVSHKTGNSVGKIQDKREYLDINNFKVRRVEQTNAKYPISIIKYNACGRGIALHPTQKPVALMEYLIKTYTNEGEVVLDFAIGSGTTALACKNLNRNFIGFENNEAYYKIACNRIGQNVS